MKLSTRSRYGVRLMLALGISEKNKPIFLKDIARSEEISEKYLSQIIIPSRRTALWRRSGARMEATCWAGPRRRLSSARS